MVGFFLNFPHEHEENALCFFDGYSISEPLRVGENAIAVYEKELKQRADPFTLYG